ncbi:ABC transporter ATP-binding protein [uncultured Sphingomonas sp.]|uniref:ABC transporter ATP-binding protein n=1 Tax=uncultured Sphingomonas sp. TaxID=158754 RepID=UPI002586EA82|nr:ABC transporter ATP-binding protein [uncultured Sphingomonas sp.]
MTTVATRPPEAPSHADSVSGAPVLIRGLGIAFDGNPVIDTLDLAVDGGTLVSIVGRSGCGKSTLLRAIIGLETPQRGSIDLDRDRARIVFQEPRLLPWFDVLTNVALGAEGLADAQDRAAETLALVGLSDKARAWPARLSGGQRQRVALARALVSRPRLLLFDEPLGALDALTRIEMQRLIEEVWTRHRFTALLVTHDVSEAVMLSDRVVRMDHGRIVSDTPITTPRPRRHGDPQLATMEGEILNQLLIGQQRADHPA